MSFAGGRRPLRWAKLAFFGLPAVPLLAAVARARPWLEAQVRHGFAAEWAPLAVLGTFAAGGVGLAGLWALVRDAGWDVPAPRPLLAALLVLACFPLQQAPLQNVVDDGPLLRCAAGVGRAAAAGESSFPSCRPGPWRDRWLRRVPLRVEPREGAEGPVLEPGDAAPGTVFVAVAAGGGWGWVTAVGLGPEGPALVREGGRPWVAGFVREGGGR